MSGKSSFLISFAYNPKVVEAIKTLPIKQYLKNIQAWEIPSDCLADALDTLTFLDNIQLILLPEIEENSNQGDFNLTQAEIDQFKFKPFKHQIDGINFLLKQGKSLLLDAPGLGKSLEMMYYAETLKRRGLIEHCLLITGIAGLRQQWKSEIQKFSTESAIVLGERVNRNGKIVYDSVKERAEQLKHKIDEFWIIMNVESLRDPKIIEAFNKSENKIDLICFDEIHRGVANKNSQSATGLLKLNSKYKVGASGSIIVNSPISAYMSLFWTENDRSTLTNFKSQYCKFGGFNNAQIVGYKNLDTLQEEIDSCSIRRTFDQVKDDMPKKTIDVELVELADDHKKFYEAVKAGVKEEADKVELKSGNLLALTTRLRQATADPAILTSEPITASKLNRVVELVEDIISGGEKVIVMDTFKSSIYTLQKLLAKYNPVIGTGDLADGEVSENINKFRTDPDCKLLLGTSQKIGTGFSMPECKYLIFVSTAWTYSEFNQNCERIYRITSNKPVFIKVLLANDTIDQRVWEVVNNKKDLADYLIDGKENPAFMSELRDIITKL